MNKLDSIFREALKLVDNKNVYQKDILFLMEDEFNVSYSDIIAHGEKEYNDELFRLKLERLKEGEPIEYIINKAQFFNRTYYVNKNTLIPRNETEELIEKILSLIKEYKFVNPCIVDIGSGSGCIAITLNKEIINSRVDSFDISKDALEVAKKNNIEKGANVLFQYSDCLDEAIKNNKHYDIIVSNPPYIDKEEYVQESVKKYEPELALYADNHGLAIYEKIFSQVEICSNKKCLIAFEISPDLVKGLKELAYLYLPNYRFWFDKDINGLDRFMFLYKNE